MLNENTKAPDFEALDEKGEKISLSDYRGKWVLLYFYPKDNTPGCTKEACAIRDVHEEFENVNAIVLGISKDSEKSHASFIDKFKLPFTLISDKDGKIAKLYNADSVILPKRVSYLIDEKGVIRKIYKNVKPEIHAKEVLNDLKCYTK